MNLLTYAQQLDETSRTDGEPELGAIAAKFREAIMLTSELAKLIIRYQRALDQAHLDAEGCRQRHDLGIRAAEMALAISDFPVIEASR